MPATDGAQTVTLSGDGRVREIAFNTRSPAVIALAGDGRVVRVDLGVGGGALVGELRQDSNASLIEANLTSVSLGSLSPDLRGRVTGRVSLRGAGDDLSGSANLTMTELRSVDARAKVWRSTEPWTPVWPATPCASRPAPWMTAACRPTPK